MSTADLKHPTVADNADSRIVMPLQINGDWSIMKEVLKKQFSVLSDDDLAFEPGKEEELVANLERTLGKDRDEIVAILDVVEHSLESTDAETMLPSEFDETASSEEDTDEGDAADDMNDSPRTAPGFDR